MIFLNYKFDLLIIRNSFFKTNNRLFGTSDEIGKTRIVCESTVTSFEAKSVVVAERWTAFEDESFAIANTRSNGRWFMQPTANSALF